MSVSTYHFSESDWYCKTEILIDPSLEMLTDTSRKTVIADFSLDVNCRWFRAFGKSSWSVGPLGHCIPGCSYDVLLHHDIIGSSCPYSALYCPGLIFLLPWSFKVGFSGRICAVMQFDRSWVNGIFCSSSRLLKLHIYWYQYYFTRVWIVLPADVANIHFWTCCGRSWLTVPYIKSVHVEIYCQTVNTLLCSSIALFGYDGTSKVTQSLCNITYDCSGMVYH